MLLLGKGRIQRRLQLSAVYNTATLQYAALIR